MPKTKPVIYECEFCGNQQSRWLGKCPECGAFNSFKELKAEQIKVLNEISIIGVKYLPRVSIIVLLLTQIM